MNKFKLMSLALAGMLCLGGLTSCGDDDVDAGTGTGTGGGTTDGPSGNTVWEQEKQKTYIEQTGREFLGFVGKNQVSAITDIVRQVRHNYLGEDYDGSAVEDRLEDILNAISSEKIGNRTETEKYYWTYVYDFTTYKKIYRASNFTGHFTAGKEGWEYTAANDLQFNFKDASNKDCVLKLTTSGENATVYIAENEDWYDYEYTDGSYTEYIREDKIYFAIPKKVNITLTQGKNKLIDVTVNTDLSSIVNEAFDLNRSSLTVSTNVTLQNIEMNVDKLGYSANKESSVSFKIKSNGTEILAGKMSGTTGFSGNTEYKDDEDMSVKISKANNINLNLDVLGKVQIKGNVSDALKFADYLDMADDNDEKEATFKSYVNQANGMMNLGIYYNNDSSRQAKIEFESFEEKGYYKSYWCCQPVLKFDDGSSYSTFDAFFNEKDFRMLIKAAEDLFDSYEAEIKRINF